MISNKWFVTGGVVFFLMLARLELQAQEAEPTPTPAGPGRESLLSKVSFLRVWYIGGPQSPRITLSSEDGGGARKVLGSSMRPGRLGSYRLLKPDPMSVVTYAGSAIPNAEGKLENPGEPLAKSDSIPLRGGAFYTLVVREESGRFRVETVEDFPPEEGRGPSFRIFDFSNLESGGVTLSTGGPAEKVWSVTEKSPFLKNFPGKSGPGRLELIGPSQDKAMVLSAFEMDLSPQKSYSIVLFIDRYGQRVFGVTEDASVDYSEQDIKEFLKAQ